MKISTKSINDDKIIYLQELDDSSGMDLVIKHLMQQPSGTSWLTVVSNNGNDMTFRTQAFSLLDFIKVANGIKPPRKTPVRRTAPPV